MEKEEKKVVEEEEGDGREISEQESKGAFTLTPQSESNAHSIRFVSVHMNPLKSNAH